MNISNSRFDHYLFSSVILGEVVLPDHDLEVASILAITAMGGCQNGSLQTEVLEVIIVALG